MSLINHSYSRHQHILYTGTLWVAYFSGSVVVTWAVERPPSGQHSSWSRQIQRLYVVGSDTELDY